MKTNGKPMHKGFTLIEILVVLSIIAALAALATPVYFSQRRQAHMIQSINNARQMFGYLSNFDSEFGAFPTDDILNDPSHSELFENAPKGDHSNRYLGALIASGDIQREELFYSKIPNVKKPNEKKANGKILERGECGFAYVDKQSTSSNGSRPLVMTPMTEGADLTFQREPFDGKAVILFVDGSTRPFRISNDGNVRVGSIGIFDTTSEDSFWQGQKSVAPLVKKPNLSSE